MTMDTAMCSSHALLTIYLFVLLDLALFILLNQALSACSDPSKQTEGQTEGSAEHHFALKLRSCTDRLSN